MRNWLSLNADVLCVSEKEAKALAKDIEDVSIFYGQVDGNRLTVEYSDETYAGAEDYLIEAFEGHKENISGKCTYRTDECDVEVDLSEWDAEKNTFHVRHGETYYLDDTDKELIRKALLIFFYLSKASDIFRKEANQIEEKKEES